MTHRDPVLRKYEKRAAVAIFGLFGAFILLSVVIGGDAFNGRIEDGVYYVASQGEDTQVSGLTYFFSITLGSVALGGLVLLVIYKMVSNLKRRPT